MQYNLRNRTLSTGIPGWVEDSVAGKGDLDAPFIEPAASAIPQRITYRYSRTSVNPPSGFDPNLVTMSGREPVSDLTLQSVEGFKGDGSGCNLYMLF